MLTPSDSDSDSSIEVIPEPGQTLRDYMIEDAAKTFREYEGEERILESFVVIPKSTKESFGNREAVGRAEMIRKSYGKPSPIGEVKKNQNKGRGRGKAEAIVSSGLCLKKTSLGRGQRTKIEAEAGTSEKTRKGIDSYEDAEEVGLGINW